jgi:translation elongation factor EF-Tu-like GTPase
MTNLQRPPDIEAEITYLPTSAGGRQGPARTGYVLQFYYDGRDWDAKQTFMDTEWVEPGETVFATLVFMSPQEHDKKLIEGTMFLIREGAKTVGYGKVTRILNLLAHAAEVKQA